MGWHHLNLNFSNVRSYREAVSRFEELAKWKDGDAILRDKKSRHLRISKLGNEYQFILYSTPVVTWVSPTEVRIEHYDSKATVEFIDKLTPMGLNANLIDGYLCVNGYKPKNRVTVWQYSKEANQWLPDMSTVDSFDQTVYDRKKVNAARKLLAPAISWMNAYERVAGKKLKPEMSYFGGWQSMKDVEEIATVGVTTDNAVRLARRYGRKLNYIVPVLKGAVTRTKLPPGAIPVKTVFDPFIHLASNIQD